MSRKRNASPAVGGWAIGLALAGVFASTAAGRPSAASRMADPPPSYGGASLQRFRMPLAFQENRGQAHPAADFLARASQGTVFLTGRGPVFSLRPRTRRERGRSARDSQMTAAVRTPASRLALTLAGGKDVELRGEDLQPGRVSYLRGDAKGNAASSLRNLRTFGRVRGKGVYPGVDLVYYGNGGQLEYDFLLAPGADPSAIRLRAEGARKVHLTLEGDLQLETALGPLVQHAPVAYQEADGKRVRVPARYVLGQDAGVPEVRFELGDYDTARPLVIDPTLSYSTLLGGADFDSGEALAADASGSCYVIGSAVSTDFPTTASAYDRTYNGLVLDNTSDVFVAKFNPTGSQLVYATYLGGAQNDFGLGIAVDSIGNAYLTGRTQSLNFPTTTGAYDRTHNGGDDMFVTKLAANGSSLVYSTYIGGSDGDRGRDIRVDSNGNTYVAGSSNSGTFPVLNAAQSSKQSLFDAVLLQLNPAGTALVFSTFLGGNGFDDVWGMDRDANGRLYVVGQTDSGDFPKLNPAQGSLGGSFSFSDGFLACFLPTGALEHSTYLGGDRTDFALGVAVDPQGTALVTGLTESTNFPLRNPYQNSLKGEADAFLTAIPAGGGSLTYSTYFGGRAEEYGNSITVDASGAPTIVGETLSNNLPLADALQTTYGGEGEYLYGDGFLARFNAGGGSLSYSTYFGGKGDDYVTAVTSDSSGAVYFTGSTNSSNFRTTTGAYSRTFKGFLDAFVGKFAGRTLPPTAPSGLTGSVNGRNVTLNWVDNSNNENSFKIERRLAGGSYGQVGTVGEDVKTYTDTTGAPDTSYEYRVRASNGAGDSLPSNVVTVRTGTGGGGPAFSATPTTLKFGKVKKGSKKDLQVVIQNISGQTQFGSASAPSAPFTLITGGGTFTLSPNTKRTLKVRFKPTAKGSFTGSVTVQGSGGASPLTIPLVGKGT